MQPDSAFGKKMLAAACGCFKAEAFDFFSFTSKRIPLTTSVPSACHLT
jgi:hypothetical protein